MNVRDLRGRCGHLRSETREVVALCDEYIVVPQWARSVRGSGRAAGAEIRTYYQLPYEGALRTCYPMTDEEVAVNGHFVRVTGRSSELSRISTVLLFGIEYDLPHRMRRHQLRRLRLVERGSP